MPAVTSGAREGAITASITSWPSPCYSPPPAPTNGQVGRRGAGWPHTLPRSASSRLRSLTFGPCGNWISIPFPSTLPFRGFNRRDGKRPHPFPRPQDPGARPCLPAKPRRNPAPRTHRSPARADQGAWARSRMRPWPRGSLWSLRLVLGWLGAGPRLSAPGGTPGSEAWGGAGLVARM